MADDPTQVERKFLTQNLPLFVGAATLWPLVCWLNDNPGEAVLMGEVAILALLVGNVGVLVVMRLLLWMLRRPRGR